MREIVLAIKHFSDAGVRIHGTVLNAVNLSAAVSRARISITTSTRTGVIPGHINARSCRLSSPTLAVRRPRLDA